ncbi:hypothetical protein MEL_027 [Melbournevirus]|uniref:hypothetical protein n=1 Tax=Melbournevirus TaxID=1560514 RepID=UPI00051F581B|nr:hypothetical protein MEL_027 [Melbournevirus]
MIVLDTQKSKGRNLSVSGFLHHETLNWWIGSSKFSSRNLKSFASVLFLHLGHQRPEEILLRAEENSCLFSHSNQNFFLEHANTSLGLCLFFSMLQKPALSLDAKLFLKHFSQSSEKQSFLLEQNGQNFPSKTFFGSDSKECSHFPHSNQNFFLEHANTSLGLCLFFSMLQNLTLSEEAKLF